MDSGREEADLESSGLQAIPVSYKGRATLQLRAELKSESGAANVTEKGAARKCANSNGTRVTFAFVGHTN